MVLPKDDKSYFDAEEYYKKLKAQDFKIAYNHGINNLLIKQNMERAASIPQNGMVTGGSEMFPDRPFLPGNYDNNNPSNVVLGGGKKNKSALRSTKAWTKYASDTIDDVLGKAERVKAISGGGKKKKSALSSTKAWTKYASDTIDDGLNKAERVKAISGGGKKKKSALSSTKAWTKYASDTIDDGLKKAERVKAISGGGSKLAWIPYVKKYSADHNVSYKEALSKASVGYKKQ